ncbi:DUF1128 domain-containing protein [Cerasibacillus sp. JNUCC 74]|jgi:uncharacterized protein YfkK (UPF0435 family)|uniref:DUF1128 domain-containing protein n=1 Tax=Virgibacillus proomii TaxID=84407 RepID=UPI00098763D7|nr:DUF1128 family protein [Virgibacillus proomii]
MNLEQSSEENFKILLDEIAEHLSIVNRTIMDPDDYDLKQYDKLKAMYDMIKRQGNLSVQETQAFLEELRTIRK